VCAAGWPAPAGTASEGVTRRRRRDGLEEAEPLGDEGGDALGSGAPGTAAIGTSGRARSSWRRGRSAEVVDVFEVAERRTWREPARSATLRSSVAGSLAVEVEQRVDHRLAVAVTAYVAPVETVPFVSVRSRARITHGHAQGADMADARVDVAVEQLPVGRLDRRGAVHVADIEPPSTRDEALPCSRTDASSVPPHSRRRLAIWSGAKSSVGRGPSRAMSPTSSFSSACRRRPSSRPDRHRNGRARRRSRRDGRRRRCTRRAGRQLIDVLVGETFS